MAYLFLAAAICAEIAGTMSLRASEGFTKPGYTAVVLIGYIAAFVLLSFALERGIPLGVAYGVWAAAGVAAVALLSVPIFGETLTVIQVGGLVMVIAGVVALKTGGAH